MITKIKNTYSKVGQYLGAMFIAPSKQQGQIILFLAGVALLTFGLASASFAQSTINYNDERIVEAGAAVLQYIEGSLGAVIMIAAGLGAIVAAAFGQYKAALSLLVVAVGAFILRSLVATFFDSDIPQETVF